MLIYATKKTVKDFKLPIDKSSSEIPKELLDMFTKNNNDLFKWGMKIFYFDHRKCCQIMNFASRFNIIMYDIKVKDINELPTLMFNYMFKLYEGDDETLKYLNMYFDDNRFNSADYLTDRTIISSLNYVELYFLDNGNIAYDYFSENVLQTIEINKDFNFKYLMTVTNNGKKEYIYPAEEFKKMLKSYYHKWN